MQFNTNITGFDNSIKNYNQIFQKEMDAFNVNFDNKGMVDFDNVLNSEITARKAMPQGPIINSGIRMDVGLENMGIEPISQADGSNSADSKRHNMSDVEKTADIIGKGFSNGLNSVNDAQHAAYNAAETFAAGGDISVHEVMLASQKANLTMQMALQLRNRMLNAYSEINNVRV